MISVVVPAHDEAGVIDRTLRTLLADGSPGDLDVVVVCNGCTDDTAERARRHGVRVVETDVASKPAALDLGDAHAAGFPRAYVDADVDVSATALRRVAEVLSSGAVLAAAPAIRLDLDGCSRAVRTYYRQWLRTPYVREDMIGSGVYVLSREGRGRFGGFPDIIADDLFVRNLFAPGERRSVPEVTFTKRAPKDLATVVRIKGRMYAGHRQLRDLGAADPPSAATATAGVRMRRPAGPRDAAEMALYTTTNALGRARAGVKRLSGTLEVWDRDETTRARA